MKEPRDYRHALVDMRSAIDGIQASTRGKTIKDYEQDWMLKHAIQRGIEIISEASRQLPQEILALTPEVPWSKVRGIGNVLRHGYHSLSDPVIWAVVVDELPRLRDAIDLIECGDLRS